MAKDWCVVSEDERPSYLDARARELQRIYGVGLAEAKVMLCAHWGWDPKKYIMDCDIRPEQADAAARAPEAGRRTGQ